MKVTGQQLTLLKFYQKHQEKPLTLMDGVRQFWLLWFGLLFVTAAGLGFIDAGWPAVGWVFIGVTIGSFLRDLKRILSMILAWPVLREIIDWDRVRELLRDAEKNA
jgi:hypothetical protein